MGYRGGFGGFGGGNQMQNLHTQITQNRKTGLFLARISVKIDRHNIRLPDIRQRRSAPLPKTL